MFVYGGCHSSKSDIDCEFYKINLIIFTCKRDSQEKYQKSLNTVRKSKGDKGDKGNRKRNIPAAIKKSVIKRSGHHCEFPGCDETKFLEFEHVIPLSPGGKHTFSNIKMYCKAHNQRAAIIQFGQVKMDKFFK